MITYNLHHVSAFTYLDILLPSLTEKKGYNPVKLIGLTPPFKDIKELLVKVKVMQSSGAAS